MADDSYKIDAPTARRIDKVIRRVLSPGERTAKGNDAKRDQVETCFGRLASLVDEDNGTWEWEEVYWQLDFDGTNGQWQTRDEGRTGSEADGRLAYEALDVTGSATDVFLLRRLPTVRLADPDDDASEDAGELNWVIVAPLPRPTKKYQVLTPIDDTLKAVWTTARFTDDT